MASCVPRLVGPARRRSRSASSRSPAGRERSLLCRRQRCRLRRPARRRSPCQRGTHRHARHAAGLPARHASASAGPASSQARAIRTPQLRRSLSSTPAAWSAVRIAPAARTDACGSLAAFAARSTASSLSAPSRCPSSSRSSSGCRGSSRSPASSALAPLPLPTFSPRSRRRFAHAPPRVRSRRGDGPALGAPIDASSARLRTSCDLGPVSRGHQRFRRAPRAHPDTNVTSALVRPRDVDCSEQWSTDEPPCAR